MRPTVGLMMIVRDEAETLPRLAGTLTGQVDHATIVDTGSVDDTVEVARRLFGHLPGQVVTQAWSDFASSRNSLLALARPQTDWLLAMDADETLQGDIDRHEIHAGVDAISVEYYTGPITYRLPRLISAGVDWRWIGRTHEHLAHPNGSGRILQSGRWSIRHHADGGSRAGKYR